MSSKISRRATGLALSMIALLLLAACGSAVSSKRSSGAQASRTPPTAEGATPDGAAVSPTATAAEAAAEYQIVTLLPPDAILSIDDPRFYGVSEADEEYHPLEPVLGVELNGEAKAYSVSLLSGHEIVNDMLAGRPIAVTW